MNEAAGKGWQRAQKSPRRNSMTGAEGWQRLAKQIFFEFFDLVGKPRVGFAFLVDDFAGVHDGSMVAVKYFGDFGIRQTGVVVGEVLDDLARPDDWFFT